MKVFAEHLKALRKRAGLTKAELARRANISPSSLSRFEHKDPAARKLPRFETLEALAKALGEDVQALLTADFSHRQAGVGALACRANHAGWAPAVVADTAILAGTPHVGAGSVIGHFALIDAAHGDVTVGENCTIGDGAHILTRATGKDGNTLTGSVNCGNNVAIGSHAVLLPGTRLDDGAVVLPGMTVGLEALLKAPEPKETGNDGSRDHSAENGADDASPST